MDKILSARINETVLNKISLLSQRLHTTKKNIIETAIQLYAQKTELGKEFDVLEQTCGAWQRKGSITENIMQTKSAFRKALMRHRK